MKESSFDAYRESVIAILRKNGVEKAALFGSFARGDDTKTSDIDLLIQFEGQKSLFDLVGLKYELEESTNRNVDLVTFNSMHPRLKDKIMAEQVRII